jgi:hypothetical protein
MQAYDGELGPVDIVVIGYPAGAPMTGEAVPVASQKARVLAS